MIDVRANYYQDEGPAHYKIINPGTQLNIDLVNQINALNSNQPMTVMDIKPLPNGNLLIIYIE